MKTKKITIIYAFLLLFILGSIVPAHSQQRPIKKRPRLSRSTYEGLDTIVRKGVFISYPTNFFATTLKLGYEFKVSNRNGLALLASVGGSDNSNSYYGVNTFNEIGFEAQFRMYILKDRPALNGLYLAPYLAYKTMSYTADVYDSRYMPVSTNFKTSDFSLGYVIGYQYIFSSSFAFNAYLGGGYNMVSGDNSGGNLKANIFDGYANGISIHTGIGIGIAF